MITYSLKSSLLLAALSDDESAWFDRVNHLLVRHDADTSTSDEVKELRSLLGLSSSAPLPDEWGWDLDLDYRTGTARFFTPISCDPMAMVQVLSAYQKRFGSTAIWFSWAKVSDEPPYGPYGGGAVAILPVGRIKIMDTDLFLNETLNPRR